MSVFQRLFRSKKSSNKENEPTELDRDMSYRRSERGGGSKSSRRERARFADNDNTFIAPTAPYHTVTAPRMHKGPQSCPGGYKEEYNPMNRSFESEFHSGHGFSNKRRDRDYASSRHGKSSRRERDVGHTSEYGSGDPSPTAALHRHSTSYHRELEDSETEEYEYQEKIMQLDAACRRFMEKWKRSEEKHMYYKDQLKKLHKTKEETEKIFLRQIDNLTRDNAKYANKMRALETQLAAARGYQNCGQGFLGMGHSQRMNLMPPLNMPSNTTTPSTSALGSVNGAGGYYSSQDSEALTETSDMSLLQNNMFDASFARAETTLPTGDFPMAPNFPAFSLDDGQDETKNFRANEQSSYIEEPMSRRDASSASITPCDDVLEDGYATPREMEREAGPVREAKVVPVRRAASDPAFPPKHKHMTTL